jgi:hypothetical protein
MEWRARLDFLNLSEKAWLAPHWAPFVTIWVTFFRATILKHRKRPILKGF